MTLKELGLRYETTHIDVLKNTQKEAWYLQINRTFLPDVLDATYLDHQKEMWGNQR